NDVPDFAFEALAIVPVEAVQGTAVDRDPVRPPPGTEDALLGHRHALIRGEPRLAVRRLALDQYGDVRHPVAKLLRQLLQGAHDQLFELRVGQGCVHTEIVGARSYVPGARYWISCALRIASI